MSRLIPILALLLLLVPTSAQAATITATNTNDSGQGSLRSALETAVDGDTIIVPAGTYRLSSQLEVVDAVTIAGAAANTVITGQGAVRVFRVSAGGPVTLQDLTISNGRVAGNGAGILHDLSLIHI